MTHEIDLRVPARPEFLHVARSVVGAAALRHDFTYEGLDDLRLAVDEAGTRLVLAAPDRNLLLRFSPRGRMVEIVLSVDVGLPGFPSDEEREGVAWTVIEALVDEVDAGSDDGTAWIRLIKRAVPE